MLKIQAHMTMVLAGQATRQVQMVIEADVALAV